jgi:multicomponent Na+:H+ antiporter subunit B
MTATDELADTGPRHRPWLGAALALGVAAFVAAGLVSLPRERAPLSRIAHEALNVAQPRWHLTEPVNEVVYGTRGFDTFGETFLLLAAVMSVVVLARHREPRRGFVGEEFEGGLEAASMSVGRRTGAAQRTARSAESGEEGTDANVRPETPDAEPVGLLRQERAHAMTVVTRNAAKTAAPILAVAGFYLCAWGYTPGGGFPAGAVLLGVVLFLYAGFGYPRLSKAVGPGVVELVELAGAVLIIVTEVLGLVFKGSISQNWLPLAPLQTIRSGGVAQLFSAGELIEVGTGLILAIFTILAIRHDWTGDEE